MKLIAFTLILLFSISSSMYADPLKAYKDMNKILKEKDYGSTLGGPVGLFDCKVNEEIVTFDTTWTSTTDNAIYFHISNIRINHLLGHKISAICWISDAYKKPLIDTNKEYCTTDGHVSVYRIIDIKHTNALVKELTLEIPKDEFHLDRNKEYRLLYNIGFYDNTDQKMIREFGYNYPFTLAKPVLLYSGTIYQSMQGYNQTTGQYVGSGPDAEFGVEIYNEYIIVSNIRYDYTRNTNDGSERVYEGTDILCNQTYYYVNPKTFAMRMVKVYNNPYMGGNEYVSYQISNGRTSFQHNNPAYNNSGNNNYGNSGGYNNSNRNNNNNNNRQRRECSLCHGKRRIVRDSSVPVYGNDSRVRCNECGGYFMRSTGHSHVTCTLCHGRGYLE